MEQTAIQEAIKEIVESWSSPGDRPNYTQILNILESKLEMEKQQIIEARMTTPLLPSIEKSIYLNEAEQYYNEKFNKKSHGTNSSRMVS